MRGAEMAYRGAALPYFLVFLPFREYRCVQWVVGEQSGSRSKWRAGPVLGQHSGQDRWVCLNQGAAHAHIAHASQGAAHVAHASQGAAYALVAHASQGTAHAHVVYASQGAAYAHVVYASQGAAYAHVAHASQDAAYAHVAHASQGASHAHVVHASQRVAYACAEQIGLSQGAPQAGAKLRGMAFVGADHATHAA